MADLEGVELDVVGGSAAMGFALGAALSARMAVGSSPPRPVHKLCVATDRVSFTNYSGRTQDMEMRLPAFAAGTRVLLVDQWIETGGTMEGAIELVERQKGVVTGLVAIAMEATPRAKDLRARFPTITAIQPGTPGQEEWDAQTLSSFEGYRPEQACPVQ